ncbi:MAG: PVC-type heme-binding CxxCH protein [Cyclobacteriaceae bacterium]
MSWPKLSIWILLVLLSCQSGRVSEKATATYEGDRFQEHIRTTEARTPEQERLGFKLPEGFKIELFASEPDIGKPMNIAFDAQGRLWVTQSHEYPFPAEPGEGVDKVSILEDTDGDGQADKFTHYVDTLNIPIGLLPLADQAFVYSIPNLYRLQDTDQDGLAENSAVVLGEFGHQDTHGMVNNLTRGYDGWVYTCHGFTNTSTVAGADGDSISMTSGNTFRFRPDGRRVEQTTFGQVNPFGLAFDEWGYLYSTDCHTSPIYQLIRGADYPHFGKKEVGIGFGPDAKPMGEESTALAGLGYYGATNFPEEYRKNFYIGDVVTCRIHRNSFYFAGSTPVAKAEEDLVKSEDPWFRPVDIKLGPDGALYVADFYNSIIGHYEVPLDHPKRDKVRGRIWRITYEGQSADKINLATASAAELIAAFDDDNIVHRMSALDELVDRVGAEAQSLIDELLENSGTTAQAYSLGLWALHRLSALDENQMQAAAGYSDPVVRTHVQRILRETSDTEQAYYPLIVAALDDENPHVGRAAVEAIANYPTLETVEYLLAQKKRILDEDTHYRYTLRLMLRNLLRDEAMMQQVLEQDWDNEEFQTLADVMPGVENPAAGQFLFDYLVASSEKSENLSVQLQHAARFVSEYKISQVIQLAQKADNGDPAEELKIFQAVEEGLAQRGMDTKEPLAAWAAQLADRALDQYSSASSTEGGATEADQSLQQAIAMVGRYELTDLTPKVEKLLAEANLNPDQKIAAAKTLLQLAPEENLGLLQTMISSDDLPPNSQRRLVASLNELPEEISIQALEPLQNLPPELQREVALALAASPASREVLFKKVRQGDLFARMLLAPKVKERLLLDISDEQLATYDGLVANVSSVDEDRDELIENRLASFLAADSLGGSGVMVFNRNCKSCHRVSNQGSLIGPQLTGIGNWGAEALATKILDPNRSISEAFRTYTIKTEDGQVMTGLYRREEGEAVVFANMNGEEFMVQKSNIAEQKASEYTLMPDHFGESLSQPEFNALLSYLLELQS